ncbi:hypothetical protein [Sphingomonas sp.]|uniref:hypothetical protein n=1 Tax=Sphingomonas sp. TaxID=28214 RepID=UPI002FDB8424
MDKPERTSEGVFRFLPNEHVLHIIGWPGPDTDDCEVLQDDGGDKVLIRYQVYGKGPFHENWVTRDMIMWKRGSETSTRYRQWKAALGDTPNG